MPDVLTEFHNEVDGFLRETGMKPSTFGMAALGDPSFVLNLKAGREPRLSTMGKVREFISSQRNQFTDLPSDVEPAE